MSDPHLEHILNTQTPEARHLVEIARSVLHELASQLAEYDQEKIHNIVYKEHKVILTISPYKRYINLNFYYGTQLQATDGVLRGCGSTLRYGRIEKPEDVVQDVLNSLLQQSLVLDAKQ
jgi:hypothetical protein